MSLGSYCQLAHVLSDIIVTLANLNIWVLSILQTVQNNRVDYHMFVTLRKVVDHYENPRNVGSLDKNSKNVGTGLVGAPACGDVMKLQVRRSFITTQILLSVPPSVYN